MSKKTLIIADDECEADLNPFSFREFLRAKSLDPDEDADQVRNPEEARFSSLKETKQGRGFDTPHHQQETTSFSELVDEEPEQLTPCEGSQIQQLQQENRILKGVITELEGKLHKQEQRAAQLSQQLSEQQRREEKEAGVLEGVVQSVEQNLDLMTKRAKKSESHVTKLKSEVKQLQTQIQSLQSDNDRLKSSHSDVVTAMRHNAHMASEYLNKTASHAHSSLRRLQDEAETLQLISQLLQSIDRISELNPDTHAEHTRVHTDAADSCHGNQKL